MKKKTIVISIFLVLLMISAIPVASALTTTSSMLYVSSYSMDPAVLYPYEQGTVSVTLGNSGNQSVGLSNPNLISDTITIDKKDSWNTMSYIASGSTITYSFLVSYPLQKIGQTNLSGLLANQCMENNNIHAL